MSRFQSTPADMTLFSAREQKGSNDSLFAHRAPNFGSATQSGARDRLSQPPGLEKESLSIMHAGPCDDVRIVALKWKKDGIYRVEPMSCACLHVYCDALSLRSSGRGRTRRFIIMLTSPHPPAPAEPDAIPSVFLPIPAPDPADMLSLY